jgi:CheY-like chemotaxis protein
LSKNVEGNLTSRQIEFSRTIHSSGNDLLTLINDILDLSKIESGTVIVDVGEVSFRDVQDYVERTFRHVAESRKLDFVVNVGPDVPRSLHTDAKRMQQILKNLLSNAFKFTERGRVTMDVRSVTAGWNPERETLNRARSVVAISVSDTGIGISPEKQQIIFEAFQQADGSTSRKYGGTGLGLAISREIAGLLGGEIRLTSTPGEGSTFTLFLPQNYVAKPNRRTGSAGATSESTPVLVVAPDSNTSLATLPANTGAASSATLSGTPMSSGGPADDLGRINSDDQVLLIIENDASFSQYLYEMAHEMGFKAVIAARGAVALSMARELNPHAITLDINLPDIDGWRVLDRLKDDVATRHIPVQIITTEEERERGLRMGAMGALVKPLKTRETLEDTFRKIKTQIETKTSRVLLVQPDAEQRKIAMDLMGEKDLEIVPALSATEAFGFVADNHFDLIVISSDIPDKRGFDLIDELHELPNLGDTPMIVYTSRDLTKKEELHLKRLSQTMVLKDVRSPERLLDEVALFLHRPVSVLPENKRQMIEQLHQAGAVLDGKKVLIVDDDIRNIFAMTSLLEPHRMSILSAETGRGAIEILQNQPDVDVVLMDIMMPDMDGYDTMRAIRRLAKFRSLPIIALTAKAMKGDREKCIEAGASDYISKPVDTEQLLAMLRVWLYR